MLTAVPLFYQTTCSVVVSTMPTVSYCILPPFSQKRTEFEPLPRLTLYLKKVNNSGELRAA